jgi:hypothetical protein
MSESTFQRAFAGGELAPSLSARADLVKYVTGLRTCRNFWVMRHGGIANRPGTRFVGQAATGSTATFLLKYVAAEVGESVLIEAGPFYLRVYKLGALVRLTGVAAYDSGAFYRVGDIAASGGVNYYCRLDHTAHPPPNTTYWAAMPGDVLEIPTPFGNGGFAWVQSGNVITMTSPDVPPHELIYYGLTTWAVRPVDTKPALGPPTGLTIAPGTSGVLSYQYVVTAAADPSYEESTAGPIGQITNVDKPTPEHPHVLSWTAPVGGLAAEYYIYCDPYGNGTFGFLGTATGMTTFRDIGYVPDFATTPPLPRDLFQTAGDFPACAGYYQQRRFFANTDHNPDGVYGSRVGFPSNFNICSPLQDDDAVTFRIAGNQHNPVRHLIGLKTLVVLTDGGAWTIGQSKVPLTPANIPADQESYVAVDDVVPVVVGNAIIYLQTPGTIVRDLAFDQQVQGFAGRDLSLYSAHLFDGHEIERLAYQPTPHSIVWAVRSDGTLLGLTYLSDQDVWGWHRHDTAAAGSFLDVVVVPEPGEDVVYVLVRRTIGGVFVRYIERLERRDIVSWAADSFFVDAGLSYAGDPVSTIAGLGHLEGQVIAVLADGRVVFNGDATAPEAADFTVTGGTLAAVIDPPASIIHAGLPIVAQIETLDLDVQTQAGAIIRDKRKRVDAVSLVLDRSARTWWAGPTVDRARRLTLTAYEAGAEQQPFTGIEEISLNTEFSPYGRLTIVQTDPLPLSILGILPVTQVGG